MGETGSRIFSLTALVSDEASSRWREKPFPPTGGGVPRAERAPSKRASFVSASGGKGGKAGARDENGEGVREVPRKIRADGRSWGRKARHSVRDGHKKHLQDSGARGGTEHTPHPYVTPRPLPVGHAALILDLSQNFIIPRQSSPNLLISCCSQLDDTLSLCSFTPHRCVFSPPN